MTRIYAIANQKGGVGKTTTAAALLAAWADEGKRVLGVDLDPQASFTTALGGTPGLSFHRLLSAYIDGEDVTAGNVHSAIIPVGDLLLLPSHLDLAGLETGAWMQADRREYVLRDLLGAIAKRYDRIVLDCPPSLGLLTVNALTAADSVLIPCSPEYLAAEGLTRLLKTVERVQKRLNPELQIAGVIPTMLKANTRHHQAMLDQIREICQGWATTARPAIPLLTAIPDKISVADAAGQGVPITRYQGGNGAADAYRMIIDQLEDR
jgi:chromosome partitioning protein